MATIFSIIVKLRHITFRNETTLTTKGISRPAQFPFCDTSALSPDSRAGTSRDIRLNDDSPRTDAIRRFAPSIVHREGIWCVCVCVCIVRVFREERSFSVDSALFAPRVFLSDRVFCFWVIFFDVFGDGWCWFSVVMCAFF